MRCHTTFISFNVHFSLLSLPLENSMKDPRIAHAMGVCKKVVSCFSHSWKQKRELEQAQKDLQLPDHKLKTECQTRWGSRLAMVKRILEQQEAITRVLRRNTDRNRNISAHILSWQDIMVLEVIDKTLTPLAEFTDALSGEQYVSVSSVKPVLDLFEKRLKVEEDDSALARDIKTSILQYLQEKYHDPKTQELLDIATSLDPRYKLDYVIDEDTKATIKARLKNEMMNVSMVTNYIL